MRYWYDDDSDIENVWRDRNRVVVRDGVEIETVGEHVFPRTIFYIFYGMYDKSSQDGDLTNKNHGLKGIERRNTQRCHW